MNKKLIYSIGTTLIILVLSISLILFFSTPKDEKFVFHTFNFFIEEELVKTVKARDNQMIIPPGTPNKKNHETIGWFDDLGNEPDFKKGFLSSQDFHLVYQPIYRDIVTDMTNISDSSIVNVSVVLYDVAPGGVQINVVTIESHGLVLSTNNNFLHILTYSNLFDSQGRKHIDISVIDSKGNKVYMGIKENSLQEKYNLITLHGFKPTGFNATPIKRAKVNPAINTEIASVSNSTFQSKVTFGYVVSYTNYPLNNGYNPDFKMIIHNAISSKSFSILLDFNNELVGLNIVFNENNTLSIPIESINDYIVKYIL